jgi:hypothetical protein
MITPNRYASGWESGCGPAEPNISNISIQAPTSSGYAPVGTGKVGTINAGNPGTMPDVPDPVQVRAFKGSDGNLYFLDNDNRAYMVTGGALAPAPPNYAPTK